jgi:hypothetical protein
VNYYDATEHRKGETVDFGYRTEFEGEFQKNDRWIISQYSRS